MEDRTHEAMMTLSEFKAWFEGFTEGMDGPPSQKQWERIQARVAEISGTPVLVDRYRTMWMDNHFYTGSPLANPGVITCLNATGANTDQGAVAFETARIGGTHLGANGYMPRFDEQPAFDSHAAMNALGKADAASLAA